MFVQCKCQLLTSTHSNASAQQMVNAGVCHVATATIPHNDEWIELVFVGVAGTWHFLPREVLENGKIVAGSVGISLAVLSIVQALYRAGRFLTRR